MGWGLRRHRNKLGEAFPVFLGKIVWFEKSIPVFYTENAQKP